MLHKVAAIISVLGLSACLASATAKDIGFDAAPFGRPLTDGNSVGVEWPEMRRIVWVDILFADDGSPLPAPETMQVQYWHHSWKGEALRPYAEQNAAWTGWSPTDDWTNGEWKTADSHPVIRGRLASFTFASSKDKEFPESKEAGVTYRPTLKIRLTFAGAHPHVERLRAITDSTRRNSAIIRLQFENRNRCDDPVEVYNGAFTVTQRSRLWAGACTIQAVVGWVLNPEDPEADRTIVTVRSPSNPFSFAVDEVERGDRIYIKDFGVLVTRADDPITIAEYRRQLEESGARCIYDRVAKHAEQTLSGAWNDMPIKRPYFFPLGLEGDRQRFHLNPDGNLWMHVPTYADRKPGRDTGHFLWPDQTTYRFGLPQSHFADRHLAEGYLPILTTTWLDGDLLYEEEAFADVLAGNLDAAEPLQADDPTIAFLKFRFVNGSSQPRTARLTLSTDAPTEHPGEFRAFEALQARGDMVMGAFHDEPVLRYLVDTRGAGQLAGASTGVTYSIKLPGHGQHTIYLKVPFVTLTEESQIAGLRALSPEQERAKVARFWMTRIAAGSEIQTPEPWLNDFYKAHLTHLLINDEREVGSGRYAARVGSFSYGVYGNESTMMIADLDRRGYAKEAERSLELFLHYQGTVPLPGNFTSQQGVLYGAGGYEAGGYNQHHGWILWCLAEHYWYTRDRVWMAHAAPHMRAACQWIISQRKTTEKLDASGKRVPEYGLLPAGSLEDVQDFWYWVSTNSFTWWGLADAAAALSDDGDPEGPALVKEAEDYRQDVLRAYREAALRSPVVRLRDGTYVPDFPSNVYTRGRSYGWIRETLEGVIMLPITRLLEPSSREAEWILKDYEDNRYISDKFGYSIPTFDQFWFSRGGFSMQPNLLNGPLPYLYRDEIKRFLRAYFNPFAANFDPTLRMLCEHPLPELGYFIGDLFKSSDESQSNGWLRLMFVMELDGALYLGRAIPRDWLGDGKVVGIRNAPTYFGKLSYQIQSSVKEGKITMSLDPPTRNAPHATVVRFRHPEEKLIQRVTVNGALWHDFDAVKGDIRLPGDLKYPTTIVAEY